MGAREAHALETLDRSARPQQRGERRTVAELHAIRVDVLPEQRHLDDALGDERLDLGEHVTGSAILLLAAQTRHDAERARVVAPHRDRDPGGVRRFAPARQRRGEDRQRLLDLDLSLGIDAGALEQHRERADVVSAEDHIDPGGTAYDLAAILLRHAATDGDLHSGVAVLDRLEVPEVAIETVVGVLSHGAGVEHDHVGLRALVRPYVARVLEQAREPLGVVDVHLAAVGADLVRARRVSHGSRVPQWARPVARDSRTTVTRIWPG